MTSRLALGLILAAGVSATAHAGLISGNYTLDNGNAVALQGLEWMPLTYTAGLSRADVEDGFTDNFGTTWAAGEWTYADREQTETLLGSLWDQRYNGWSNGNGAGAQWFLRNFGGLALWIAPDGTITETYTDTYWTHQDASTFFFGNVGDCSPSITLTCLGRVGAADNYSRDEYTWDALEDRFIKSYTANTGALGYFNDYQGLNAGLNIDYNYTFSSSQRTTTYGSLLVRKAAASPTPTVSAPTSLSIVAIGLLSLLLRRRRSSDQ